MLNILKSFEQIKSHFNSHTLKSVLPSLILVSFFFSEFISKYFKYQNLEFTRVSAVVKLAVEIFLCYYILVYKKESRKDLIKILSLFTLVYVCGQFFLLKGDLFNRFLVNAYILNGYVFIFILYYALKPINQDDRLSLKKQLLCLDLTIKSIFSLNTSVILIGLIFNLNLFKTYLGYSDRFGYNGFFLHASHSSYIYIILILYFFMSYVNKKSTTNLLFLLSSICFSLMIGTKTIYLFNALFLIYFLFRFVKRLYAFSILSIVAIIGLLTYSTSLEILKNNFGVLHKVLEEHGVITMLFSYRDINVIEGFFPYINENWSSLNYIFGGAEFITFRTEIEIIDLLWFFGFFGAIVYLKLFYSKILKDLFKVKYLKFPILVFLLCAILSGSFLTNAPIIPYFIILYYAVTSQYYQNSKRI